MARKKKIDITKGEAPVNPEEKNTFVEEKPRDIPAPEYDIVTEGGDPKDCGNKKDLKDKEFNKFISSMEKEFGVGSIVSADKLLEVEKVSTNNLLLDILLEGGLPKGSISLFYGPFSSGKTVVALMVASKYTQQKIPVLYIAVEGDIDKKWVKKLGNNLEYFHIARPNNLEQTNDLADVAVRSKKFGLVIIDSVTAGIPQEALNKKSEQDQMALQARRNTKLVQKLTSGLQPESLAKPESYNNTLVILIAQLRNKVGFVMGSSEILPGGESLKHHSSVIVKVRGASKLKKNDEIIGREMKFTVERSKYSKPLVSGITEFFFSPPRFNNIKVLINYATKLGIIEQAGPYYTYKDIKVQGKEKLLKELKEQNLIDEVKQKLITKFNDE